MLLVIRAENAGLWTCALAPWNGTPADISSDFGCSFASDYESAAMNSSADEGSWS